MYSGLLRSLGGEEFRETLICAKTSAVVRRPATQELLSSVKTLSTRGASRQSDRWVATPVIQQIESVPSIWHTFLLRRVVPYH